MSGQDFAINMCNYAILPQLSNQQLSIHNAMHCKGQLKKKICNKLDCTRISLPYLAFILKFTPESNLTCLPSRLTELRYSCAPKCGDTLEVGCVIQIAVLKRITYVHSWLWCCLPQKLVWQPRREWRNLGSLLQMFYAISSTFNTSYPKQGPEESLESIPIDFGRKAEYTLNSSPVSLRAQRETDEHSHPHIHHHRSLAGRTQVLRVYHYTISDSLRNFNSAKSS